MSSGVESWIELAMTVLIAVIAISGLSMLIRKTSQPVVPDQSDKTALAVDWIEELPMVEGEDGSWHADLTGRTVMDVIVSGIVTDTYAPYPRSYRVNDTPIVDLTDEWVLAKYQNVLKLWNKNGTWKFWSLQNTRIRPLQFQKDSVNGDYYQITTQQ